MHFKVMPVANATLCASPSAGQQASWHADAIATALAFQPADVAAGCTEPAEVWPQEPEFEIMHFAVDASFDEKDEPVSLIDEESW